MAKNEKNTTNRVMFERLLRFWLPVILWGSVIFLFSTRPTKPSSQIDWQDFIIKKSAHIVEYAVLTVLLYRALKESGVDKKEAGIYAIIMAILYGASDEFHQSFTPGREPRVRDIFFDTIGGILAMYSIWNLLPKAPEKLKSWAKSLQII
jgi:VanZ family protein